MRTTSTMIIKFISLLFFISESRLRYHPRRRTPTPWPRRRKKGRKHKKKCFDIHHHIKLCIHESTFPFSFPSQGVPLHLQKLCEGREHKKLMLKIEISIDLFLLHARDHLLIIDRKFSNFLPSRSGEHAHSAPLYIVNLHGDEKFFLNSKHKTSC